LFDAAAQSARVATGNYRTSVKDLRTVVTGPPTGVKLARATSRTRRTERSVRTPAAVKATVTLDRSRRPKARVPVATTRRV
jgi:hypothetical protein